MNMDYSVSDYSQFFFTPLNQKSRIHCMDSCAAIKPKQNNEVNAFTTRYLKHATIKHKSLETKL
jgi:hypothetical protein